MVQTRYQDKIFWRSPTSAFFTIFFPLLIFVVFSLVFGNEEIDYLGITTAQYYAPALAVFAAVSATYTNIAITTAYQRDEGILKRVRGTPLPASVYMGGKIVSATEIAAIGTVIMLGAGFAFFGLRLAAANIWVLVVIFLVGVATFASLGLLVAAFAPSGQAATAIANATLLPLAFVSGVFIVPSQEMPAWLAAIANFFPLKHFVEPFVSAFSPEAAGGLPWGDLAYMAVWGASALLLAARFFRWEPPVTATSGTKRRRRQKA